jgi:hypothetical protein
MRRLRCAAEIIAGSGERELLRKHRSGSRLLPSGNSPIRLQSQAPLRANNVAFEENWALEDLIECLNGFVFFWPGKKHPSPYGMRHFESSMSGNCAVSLLRVNTAKLLDVESENRPLFCRYNSGSPRCVDGRKSPRGPGTFLPHYKFEGTLAEVVEVVFSGSLALPDCTQLAESPTGPWRPFFESD